MGEGKGSGSAQWLRALRRNLAEIPADHWRFSGVEFLYWFAWAASGYLTVFLQSRGMSASEVGLIGALNSAVGIVAAPFWGMVSDRLRSVRKVLLLVIALSGLTWSLTPLTADVPVFGLSLGLIVIPFGSFFRVPTGSLVDSWVVQNANRQRFNYGSIRLWGSIGYAVMNMSLSAMMPWLGVENTFYIFGVSVLPLLGLCYWIKDDAVKLKTLSLRQMQVGRLFREYYFVFYLLFSVMLNMPVNTIFTFLPYLMEETQVSTDLFGVIMGYKALLEIPVLLLMARLRRRYSLPKLMLAAAGLYVVECLCYSFINGLWPLLAVQTLHGLAGGMFIGCSSNYVYSLAPDHLKATAQTLAGSVSSLADIIGNLLGGYLLDAMGVRSFYTVCGGLILGAALFFLASFALGARLSGRPSPLHAKGPAA